MNVEGSIALVTGANRGIGRAIAAELLARGAAKVYAGVRDPRSVTDERLIPVTLDVTNSQHVTTAAEQLADVTLVVNNAGIASAGTPLVAEVGAARTQLEVNYLGLVRVTQAFAPILEANGGGAFVNMLSVVSWVGMPVLATYSASKAAAWAYSNAARVELKAQGTEVVSVHVGFVDTDLAAGFGGEKVAAPTVAVAALDALEAGAPEAIVDELSRGVKAGLSDDQNLLYPEIEAQFRASAGAR